MALVPAFVDDAALAAREIEVPAAQWNSGMLGGGNNCGLGIGVQAGLAESLPNWTLLDQHGNARVGQIGQHIGGLGYSNPSTSSGTEATAPGSTIRFQDSDTFDGTGTLSFPAPNCELNSLAVGWEAQVP